MVKCSRTGRVVGRIDLPYGTGFTFRDRDAYSYFPFDTDSEDMTEDEWEAYLALPVFTDINVGDYISPF